jgi:hypothetical protein
MDNDALKAQFVAAATEASDNLEHIDMDRHTLGPWSVSKLKCLQNCPLQFYLKYVLKVKLPKKLAEQQDTFLADVGSSAHKILENVVFGKSLTQSFALARNEFVTNGKLTPEQWKESVESLEANIVSFKERLEGLERQHPFKRTLTEIRLGVTRDWEPTGFFGDDVYIRGVIDLAIQLQNGDAIFIDHKKGGSADFGLKVYDLQLKSYLPLFHYGIEKVKGAQAGVHWIGEGSVRLGDYISAQTIEEDLTVKMNFYFDGAIDTVKELGYFKHKAGNACKYCEFAPMCKAKELLPLEKSTKKFFEIKQVT